MKEALGKFASVCAAVLVAFVLLFIVSFISSMYVENRDRCTVTGLTDFSTGRMDAHVYRVHTSDCGTFSISSVPLRGVDHKDAGALYHSLQLGEQYDVTFIREGFRLATIPSLIAAEPAG